MTREQGETVKNGSLFQSVISPYLQTESGCSCWSENFRIASTVKQHKMPQNDFCIQTNFALSGN